MVTPTIQIEIWISPDARSLGRPDVCRQLPSPAERRCRQPSPTLRYAAGHPGQGVHSSDSPCVTAAKLSRMTCLEPTIDRFPTSRCSPELRGCGCRCFPTSCCRICEHSSLLPPASLTHARRPRERGERRPCTALGPTAPGPAPDPASPRPRHQALPATAQGLATR